MREPRGQQLPPSERIAIATLSLVAERGLGGVTMTAIARAAGVARQTLYNHYSDVEAIVSAVIAQHQEQSVQQLTELLATVASPQDRLEHLIRHTAATAHGHPPLRHGFSAEVQAIVDGYDQAMRSHIETIIQDGVEQGVFRDDLEPTVDALVVQRMIEATAELVSANPDAAPDIVTSISAAVHGAVTAH